MSTSNVTFYERAEQALNDEQLQRALKIGVGNLISKRAKAYANFPQIETTRDRARLIRAHTLSRLDEYLAQFADSIEAVRYRALVLARIASYQAGSGDLDNGASAARFLGIARAVLRTLPKG